MIKLPFGFWFESPSTFTFIFWIVLWLWGLLQLPLSTYDDVKRIPKVYRLVNCMMIVGLIAFIYDSTWIFFQIVKFGHLYPSDLNEILLRFGQNAGLFCICFLFIFHLFEKKILEFQSRTYDLLIIQLFYFIAWFYLAPDPSWTDWTYAIRHGFPREQIYLSFIISHVIGKMIQGLTFISLWRN